MEYGSIQAIFCENKMLLLLSWNINITKLLQPKIPIKQEHFEYLQ